MKHLPFHSFLCKQPGFLLTAFLWCCLPALLSCKMEPFSQKETVAFTLAVPEAYKTVQTWRVLYIDENNDVQEMTVDRSESEEASFQVPVMKGCTLPVLSYPATWCRQRSTAAVSYVPKERPLGAIYPYTTELTSTNGFAADILKTLYSGASGESGTAAQVREYLSRFNWARLMEVCATYEDAWQLDRARILEAIASGTFKTSTIALDKGQ